MGIRVLSLFDGIGTARCVLDSLDIPLEAYFSSEVDEKAISVLKYNYYNKITLVGDVKKLTNEKLASFGRIHLLLGGSPCSDLSLCNPKRRGLHGQDSSGKLFFEFHRILVLLSSVAKKEGRSFYWLFENTYSMENVVRDEISRYLGCDPVVRCASAHVPMVRKRYFWGNIPHLSSPSVSQHEPDLQDILMPYRTAAVKIVPTLTTTLHSQYTGKIKKPPVKEDGTDTHLLITEQEVLFRLCPHFTDVGLSISDRRKLLGKSWCIPVIRDILKPLAEQLKNPRTIL